MKYSKENLLIILFLSSLFFLSGCQLNNDSNLVGLPTGEVYQLGYVDEFTQPDGEYYATMEFLIDRSYDLSEKDPRWNDVLDMMKETLKRINQLETALKLQDQNK